MAKRVTLQDLIQEKIIQTPFVIQAKFKGVSFSAEIDQDGFVMLEGRRYKSLSFAAGIIRAKLSGKPKDGFPYRRANGWTFWHYIDSNGNQLQTDNLRKIREPQSSRKRCYLIKSGECE